MARDRGGDPTSWETTGIMTDADYRRLAAARLAPIRAREQQEQQQWAEESAESEES